eukprot:CAMPEP_0194298854 /NCGR_PEP_ID=MMETSP0169-20130528/60399_1 /TAXON_ID=218684 /ORGANISM="Corethron pennatum, Strain L29A3" /LENGTH=243 /DNA_ID=CAMNT_0039048893 /DNA_START=526 /DNA_END=1257 /DNA_ORIENTATION=+
MKFLLALTLIIGSAAAFTPLPVAKLASARLMADAVAEDAPAEEAEVEELAPVVPLPMCISKAEVLAEPNTVEFGSLWDPAGLADIGSDETMAWYRHSEIKHGRVAMAAFVGWWAVGAGLRLPGDLMEGISFASVPSKGLEAWDAVPGFAKVQMLLFAGLIEFHDELFYSRRGDGLHYLRGGVPGKNMCPGVFDPLGISEGRSEEAKARGRSVEIKNGRLAMIGIASLWMAAVIPGSIPSILDP